MEFAAGQGTWVRPFLGPKDPKVVMFTVLSTKKGGNAKIGKTVQALAYRDGVVGPQER